MEEKKNYSFKDFIQQYLYTINEFSSKIREILFLIFNLLFCFLFIADTYNITYDVKNILWTVEVTLTIFFIIDYILRLYIAKQKIKYIFSIYAIVDILSIMPTLSLLILPLFGLSVDIWFIKLFRILKVIRIFRFLKYTTNPDFFFGRVTIHLLRVIRLFLVIMMLFFIAAGMIYYFENSINDKINNFGDSFYFTVVALTTVGFGDISPVTTQGRIVTILAILSGIIIIPWQASRIIKEWAFLSNKVQVTCKKCGLRYHDKDASHCKHCGTVIYQETDGE